MYVSYLSVKRTWKILTYLLEVPGCANTFANFDANRYSLLICCSLVHLQCGDGAVRGSLPGTVLSPWHRSARVASCCSEPSAHASQTQGQAEFLVGRGAEFPLKEVEREGRPKVRGEMTWLWGALLFGNICGNFLFLPNQDLRSQNKKWISRVTHRLLKKICPLLVPRLALIKATLLSHPPHPHGNICWGSMIRHR